MVVFIPAAHAVQNRDAFGFLTVCHEDCTAGGARSATHCLELETGDDIIKFSITILLHLRRVKLLKTGGDNDITDFDFFVLFFHVMIDGFPVTELRTDLALARLEVDTVISIYKRHRRYRGHKWYTDCRVGSEVCFGM